MRTALAIGTAVLMLGCATSMVPRANMRAEVVAFVEAAADVVRTR